MFFRTALSLARSSRKDRHAETAMVHKKHLTTLLQALLRLKNVKKRQSKSIYTGPHDGNQQRRAFIAVLRNMKNNLVGRRTFKMINDSLLRPMPAFYRHYIQQTNQKIVSTIRRMGTLRKNAKLTK